VGGSHNLVHIPNLGISKNSSFLVKPIKLKVSDKTGYLMYSSIGEWMDNYSFYLSSISKSILNDGLLFIFNR